MSLSSDETNLLKAISFVVRKEGIRVCVQKSAAGALLCGTAALVGGLLMGPRGIAVGGALGGLSGYLLTEGSFRPLAEVLDTDLTVEEKKRLIKCVKSAVSVLGITEMSVFIPRLLNGEIADNIQTKLIDTITSFMANEMQIRVVS